MEIGLQTTLETKQILSQKQVESLAILSMPFTELHAFLQKEEIENPLLDYAMADTEKKEETPVDSGLNIDIRDSHVFYCPHGNRQALYEIPAEAFSVEDMVLSQIPPGTLSKEAQKAAAYAVKLLDEHGFLPVTPEEIAGDLSISPYEAEACLKLLKRLEPKGIFAKDLTECLEIQVTGLCEEKLLRKLIREHLSDIAEGRISRITRHLKISTGQVRQLIERIRGLNPRPLNGHTDYKTEYIIPDILFQYEEGQWHVVLNDNWGGSLGINRFYTHMMNQSQDTALREYFQEKLGRARFITKSVEQRRETLLKIASYILERQEGYFCHRESLATMTMEEAARVLLLNPSTISRAIKGKYYASPRGSALLRSLFTSGTLNSGNGIGAVSRAQAQYCLQELINNEEKTQPYSDETLAFLLGKQGIEISRRTVAKYRAEMEIPGTYGRKR